MRNRLAASLLIALSACRSHGQYADEKATPEQRRLIGPGTPYIPAARTDADKLNHSMKARRAKAWEIFAAITREVRIGDGPGIVGFKPEAQPTLPLWQTWYAGPELTDLFRLAYGKLRLPDRQAKKPFCPESLDSLFETHAERAVPGFTDAELEQRLAQLKTVSDVHGVSGRGMTLFSPGLVRHFLENYRQVIACDGVHDAYAPDAIVSASNHSPCFGREFPTGLDASDRPTTDDLSRCFHQRPEVNHGAAVALKTTWHRVGGKELAVFDTDAKGLARHLSDGDWRPDRQAAESTLRPEDIYSIKLAQSDSRYHLAAMHVVSKETRDWLWMTFWWSPEPDGDFGEDRPPSLKGTPWGHYKMCVVSGYKEEDPDPGAPFAATHPSLAAALTAAKTSGSPYTWCSDPYVELGKGNSKTNCIGCHQHAGTAVVPDEVFLDDPSDARTPALRAKFPFNSRSRIRNNFPGEYLWAYSSLPDFFEASLIGAASEIDNDL